MTTVPMKEIRMLGQTGMLADKIINHWLIGLKQANPAILDMFIERNRQPYRDLLPWSGEFAGKHITGAYYIYRLTLNPELRREITDFINELIACQDEDGYLGCYNDANRLTGRFSVEKDSDNVTWDSWSHYHIIYGLLLWYHETGKAEYLDAVIRAAEFYMLTFYNKANGGKTIVGMGESDKNLAVLHVFALLYSETHDERYLVFANHIIEDLQDPDAGNYLSHALGGGEFYACPKPRWESLHIVIGLAEMYRATGDERYLSAAQQIYFSIQRTDVHNTGAFSTAEQAVGSPFRKGAIETCCVIAYNALGVEIFKLTGKLEIVDYLEHSHYNACMGFWSPSGRWSTYDTPMEGEKRANTDSINFQSRPGSPELNCCSVNAPRGIGMLSEWAVTEQNGSLCLNCFEKARYVTENGAVISVAGDYPADNKVLVNVDNYTGRLGIRIPGWSVETQVIMDGSAFTPRCGEYWSFDCNGHAALVVEFDFATRYLKGREDFAGKTSIFRGPILFGTDVSMCGDYPLDELPMLKKAELDCAPSHRENGRVVILLKNGVRLCDFYGLGMTGCRYTTWLKVDDFSN